MNADLKVGGVAETVTVTGEAPTVDVTSTRNQQVLSSQTVAEIPSSRNYSAFTHLIPAINVQQNDFEGSNPALYSVFQIHGGRRNEGQVLVDGMNGGYQGMGVSGYVPEVGNSQEVVFNLSGGLGEATTGGPQMNIVGKQGGNRFAGTFFMSGTGSAFQGNNLTPDIIAKGLTATGNIQKLWEVNPSLGGPIVKRQAVVLRHVPLPAQQARRPEHVGQQERGQPERVDLRPGQEPAGDQRRLLEAGEPAGDLAADAAQQVQLLVKPAVFLHRLRTGRRRDRAWVRRVDPLARSVQHQHQPPEHA